MPRTQTFYRSSTGKAEFENKRETFKFDQPNPNPKTVILIAGKEGTGKTHFASTMSTVSPVYLIDTEYRAQIVTRKFRNIKTVIVRNYTEMAVAVQHIIFHQQPGTIILDSGSDLQTFAEIEYLSRTDKEKVGMPWNWVEVWSLCNAVIDAIRSSQKFDLVVTARMRDEYINDKATGRLIPRIYSTLSYKADAILELNENRKLTLKKNGFSGDLTVKIPPALTLPKIIQLLAQNTSCEVNNSKLDLKVVS